MSPTATTPLPPPSAAHRFPIWRALGVVAIFFAAVAPTLSWPQFSGDSEDLLVQSVLEMRHGGPWWVPTLGGHPRLRKPPLPAWITAAFVSPATIRELDSPEPAAHDAAYTQLAFQVRLPALLAACAMLLAVGWMADVLGGRRYVIPAILICATSLLFVRFIRSATTDVYLALWVTVANACFVAGLLRGRRRAGVIGDGAALGLALMSKGPVALVETVVPFAAFLAINSDFSASWSRRACRGMEAFGRALGSLRNGNSTDPESAKGSSEEQTCGQGVLSYQRAQLKRITVQPRPVTILLGAAVTLAIALPWPLITALSRPGSLRTWFNELRNEGERNISHDPIYSHISLLPNMLPWLPFFIAGIYLAVRRRRLRKMMLALLLLVGPVVVLSLFRNRKERYLLPMAGPAAILAAHAAVRLIHHLRARDRWIITLHWCILLAIGIGLPLAGSPVAGHLLPRLAQTTPTGEPWYPLPLAIGSIVCAIAVVAAAIHSRRRAPSSFLTCGAAMMLLMFALFLHGWTRSASGLSEMKPVADRIRAEVSASAQVVYYDPPPANKPVTLDLDIYLNRPIPVLHAAPPSPLYDGVTAVVMLRKSGDPEPALDGWRPRFHLVSRKHDWYVLMRGVKRNETETE